MINIDMNQIYIHTPHIYDEVSNTFNRFFSAAIYIIVGRVYSLYSIKKIDSSDNATILDDGQVLSVCERVIQILPVLQY